MGKPEDIQLMFQRLATVLKGIVKFRGVWRESGENMSPAPYKGELWVEDDHTSPVAKFQLAHDRRRVRAFWNCDVEVS